MRFSSLIICSLFIVLSGCGGSNSRPKDLPALTPVNLTITQDGQPLAEATIRFVSVDGGKWNPVAFTDAAGHVEMKTYSFIGVPAGKYKVLIEKEVKEDVVEEKNAVTGVMEEKSYTLYRVVDEKYADAKTTPHEIEVSGKGKKVEQTFDVGKAIKKRL
ncbi:MAG: carboxypeptidase-like regulatory domain-containing protein [Planctomycetaceae bacterium]|jgi:hypothetical protein|nr:carboxypeptidase-like regulatory domain-containing protein [Planctomycetaceae bacterium]